MTPAFGQRVLTARAEFGPVCAGIDPHPELLGQWGVGDDADGLARFADACVDAFAGQVGFVKPQAAFFERHGARGMGVLERTIRDLRSAGTLVVLDAKRGDIGSTAQAYADAYLNPSSPMACDALTISPFLGFGSLEPFLAAAERHGGGVFVLALTSNPEGREVQHARHADETVAGSMLRQIAARNAGAEPLGSIGAVVGATIGSSAEDLAINGPILVPGIGAQGGTVEDVRRIFGAGTGSLLAATARGILQAGPEVADLRDALDRARADFAAL